MAIHDTVPRYQYFVFGIGGCNSPKRCRVLVFASVFQQQQCRYHRSQRLQPNRHPWIASRSPGTESWCEASRLCVERTTAMGFFGARKESPAESAKAGRNRTRNEGKLKYRSRGVVANFDSSMVLSQGADLRVSTEVKAAQQSDLLERKLMLRNWIEQLIGVTLTVEPHEVRRGIRPLGAGVFRAVARRSAAVLSHERDRAGLC
eukprot:6827071-Pyramimonas_sp.AAC.1